MVSHILEVILLYCSIEMWYIEQQLGEDNL